MLQMVMKVVKYRTGYNGVGNWKNNGDAIFQLIQRNYSNRVVTWK